MKISVTQEDIDRGKPRWMEPLIIHLTPDKSDPVRLPVSLTVPLEVHYHGMRGERFTVTCNNRELIAYDLRCAGYCVVDPPEPREVNDRTDWNESQRRLDEAIYGRAT